MDWIIGYVIGWFVTLLYVGFTTGKQFFKLEQKTPEAPISVNWSNIFYQCLVWPAHWMLIVGKTIERWNSSKVSPILPFKSLKEFPK